MDTAFEFIGQFLLKEGPLLLGIGLVVYVALAWDKTSEAEDYLRWRTRTFPKSATAHLDLGQRLAADEPNEAEAEIRQAIALNPRQRAAYYALVSLQITNHKPLEATEQTVERMLELFPDDPVALASKGLLLEGRGSYAEAEAAYRKAVQLAPFFPRGYSSLGDLLTYRTGNYADGERAYRQAIQCEPTHWAHYFSLAAAVQQQGRWQEAADCYRNAIRRNPKYGPAYVYLGLVLLAVNKAAEAEKAAVQAMRVGVEAAYDELNLGVLLRALRRFEEAERACRRAIAKDNNLSDAYVRLGFMLSDDLKRQGEAEAVYRQGLSLHPGDPQLNRWLAMLLLQTHRQRDALPYLERILSTLPDDFPTHLELALVYKACGQQELFLEHTAKGRALIPSDDFYDLACLESICDNKELAFQHLSAAASHGGLDRAWSWQDPDLESIRDDPRFIEIVGPRKDATHEQWP